MHACLARIGHMGNLLLFGVLSPIYSHLPRGGGWVALREGSRECEKQRSQEEGSGSRRGLLVPIWATDVALFTGSADLFPCSPWPDELHSVGLCSHGSLRRFVGLGTDPSPWESWAWREMLAVTAMSVVSWWSQEMGWEGCREGQRCSVRRGLKDLGRWGYWFLLSPHRGVLSNSEIISWDKTHLGQPLWDFLNTWYTYMKSNHILVCAGGHTYYTQSKI